MRGRISGPRARARVGAEGGIFENEVRIHGTPHGMLIRLDFSFRRKANLKFPPSLLFPYEAGLGFYTRQDAKIERRKGGIIPLGRLTKKGWEVGGDDTPVLRGLAA